MCCLKEMSYALRVKATYIFIEGDSSMIIQWLSSSIPLDIEYDLLR